MPAKKLDTAARAGRVGEIRKLLTAGEAIDAADRDGLTPLMAALVSCQYKAAEALIEAGANVNAVDRSGESVLHHAATFATPSLLQKIVDRGADLSRRNRAGEPPLLGAMTAKIVEVLLQAGADPNARRSDGFSLFDLSEMAAENGLPGSKSIIDVLRKSGAKPTPKPEPPSYPLHEAVRKGDVSAIRRLLKAGRDINEVGPGRYTPIKQASESCQFQAFQVLLDAGADLDAGTDIKDVLNLAALVGSVDIVRAALDHGLPVDGTEKHHRRDGRWTPLMGAALGGHAEVVRLLLERGCAVDAWHGEDRETALAMARKSSQANVVELLKRAGGKELEPPPPPIDPIAIKFETAARQPRYQKVVKLLERLSGKPGKRPPARQHGEPWESPPGVLHFVMSRDRIEGLGKRYQTKGLDKHEKTGFLMDQLLAEVRKSGFYLTFEDQWGPGSSAKLLLFPTRDKFEVIAARGTDGANYFLSTEKVIAWLRKLDETHPFILTHVDLDTVAGEFRKPVPAADAPALAKRMYKFCPDIVDQGCETVKELAEELARGRNLFFWWD